MDRKRRGRRERRGTRGVSLYPPRSQMEEGGAVAMGGERAGEDRGAKYLYNNRLLEERRRGRRREGGESSLRR